LFWRVSLEELTGNLVGLEQRINAYKNRLPETKKQRRRLDDEIATIKNYLELTRNPSSRGGE